MFKNAIEYLDQSLNILSPAELEGLVENCFKSKTKDYELLAKITSKLHYMQLCPFLDAISLLEVDAITVMLDSYSKDALESLRSNDGGLGTLWGTISSERHLDITNAEKKEKIVSIAKLLFPYKENITQSDLESYAKVAPLIDFHNILIDRKINLSEMDLNLPQYNILNQEPLLKGMNYKSIEDVLLMHTYTTNKTQVEVKAIYTNLLHSSKMASDIMHFTAINLINGDDLKITFTSEAIGYYAPLENQIVIGEIGGKFTLESVAIHELAHYAVFSIFPYSQGAPFDLLSKTNLLKTTQDDLYGYHLNKEASSKELKFSEEVHNDVDKFLKYEQGAKEVIIKAGELLGLERSAFDPYVLSKDFMLFIKDNTLIDLFMDNFEATMGRTMTDFTLSRKMSFYEAYYSYLQGEYEDSCPIIPIKLDGWLPVEKDPSEKARFEEITQFVREEYFPYIISKFALNDDKIFFIERIVELISQGKDIYDCPSSYFGVECHHFAYYQELMVRYPELKAANIETELLDSFSGLIDAWEGDAALRINQVREDFIGQQTLLDFSYQVEC